MLPAVQGYLTWHELDAAEKQRHLEAAERKWRAGDMPIPWESLTQQQREFCARTYLLVLDDDDPRWMNDPNLRWDCFLCRDVCYLRHGKRLWFCSCRAGLAAEASYWFDRLYRKAGRKYVVVETEREKFQAYLRTRDNGLQIRDAVNAIAEQREAAQQQSES